MPISSIKPNYAPVNITGFRAYKSDGKDLLECRCNGVRIADYAGVGAVERMKNSCKAIKVTGITDPDELNDLLFKNYRIFKQKYGSEVDRVELPEWDEKI